MPTTFQSIISNRQYPFVAGWSIVMLSLTFSIGQPWETFIHMWRVEFVASIFLAVCLIAALKLKRFSFLEDLGGLEIKFIVLPILALICWGSLSMLWAPSWKSALHHSLVWSCYLVFFFLIRSLLHSRNAVGLSLTMLTAYLAFVSVPAFFGYISYTIFGGGLRTGITFQKYGEQATALLPLIMLAVIRSEGKAFALGTVGLSSIWLLVLCGLGRMNLILFVGAFAVTALAGSVWRSSPAIRRRVAILTLVLASVSTVLYSTAFISTQETLSIAGRIAGNENTDGSNSFRKLMASLSVEMITSHPFTGIGADNFGFLLNDYRAAYAAQNPDDRNLSQAESEIPERAHNELLQILAELGIVGGLIVGWLLAGIGLMAFRAVKYRLHSQYRLAAYFGLLIFFASSLVSSFSFRLIQNGFVFFFLLAVCSKYFLKDREREAAIPSFVPPARIVVAGLVACLLLAMYSSVRVSSEIAARSGDEIVDVNQAATRYHLAMRLDNENPNAPDSLGMRLFFDRRFSEAAPYLQNAINIGKATSTDFSYLASAQTLAGDNVAAEETMKRAAVLYPRSVFVLVRHALLARGNGKTEIATATLERARALDLRSANSWIDLIDNGPQSASERAFADKDHYRPVMDLVPYTAIYAALDERDIRNPGERRKVAF